MMKMQPKGRRVSDRIAQRMREVMEQLQGLVQMKQLLLQRWGGVKCMARAVQQGLDAGRVYVRQLVVGTVDAAVGKEVDGVVLPRPKLRAPGRSTGMDISIADQETKVTEMATEEAKATTIEGGDNSSDNR